MKLKIHNPILKKEKNTMIKWFIMAFCSTHRIVLAFLSLIREASSYGIWEQAQRVRELEASTSLHGMAPIIALSSEYRQPWEEKAERI